MMGKKKTIRLISLGAGVQSSTMHIMAAAGMAWLVCRFCALAAVRGGMFVESEVNPAGVT